MSNLRRPTKVNCSNSNPLAGIKPQGGVTDRYCVKCKTWKPSKGGRQMPGTKLWICAAEHKSKFSATPATVMEES